MRVVGFAASGIVSPSALGKAGAELSTSGWSGLVGSVVLSSAGPFRLVRLTTTLGKEMVSYWGGPLCV